MSSSNEVRLAYIVESTYNTTPATGNFQTMRFTSESLSGSPQTADVDDLRSDRQSSGQVITGLSVGGQVNGRMYPAETGVIDFIEAAMHDTWSTAVDSGALTLALSATGTSWKITRATGDFSTATGGDGFVVGDQVYLTGYSDTDNNSVCLITAVTSSVLTVVGPTGMTASSGSGDEHVLRAPYVEIGTTRRGFSVEKMFTDLTTTYTKTISYTGMRVNTMDLSFQRQTPIECSFGFAGAGHSTPTTPMTDSRTVTAAGTETPLNASSDFGAVFVDGARVPFCIESLSINLNNNMQPQECIGKTAPSNQVPFRADVGVSLSAFLDDDNFEYHDKKITQTAIAVHYSARNSSGYGYGVSIPAVQLSFEDAAGGGANQHVMINSQGQAKKDATFGNTLRVYKYT